jgi:hypothetical protein
MTLSELLTLHIACVSRMAEHVPAGGARPK